MLSPVRRLACSSIPCWIRMLLSLLRSINQSSRRHCLLSTTPIQQRVCGRVHCKVWGSRSPIQSILSHHRTTSDRTACVDAEATGDHLHPPARPLFQHAAQGMCGVRLVSANGLTGIFGCSALSLLHTAFTHLSTPIYFSCCRSLSYAVARLMIWRYAVSANPSMHCNPDGAHLSFAFLCSLAFAN